ncbi:tetratricopeptide repeat-containing response regulator [Agarilytica rhodophyticola]|uniref:tetratricopeptide repeat-containing response regulator n=1 Tax=Agarilytica rhodophyticola TaxID=1737490 RepID=UPI000B34633E|nr:tetratricopeptide repeat-containing response regulator [Agarilytica rhodophyticola]
MKQIDIIKTYSQKRCLIVDDNPDVRTSLKRILVDFGCNDVDTAGHGDEAIELSERHHYDIVLADYNLGNGKNGQQLLEELRYQSLLKNTSIYIMITAESAVQHVIHALQFQPDDYLHKPIQKESLRPRLDAILLKNEALIEVKEALDQRQLNSAVKACRKLLEKDSKHHNDVNKMLGELLCQQGLFEQALKIYSHAPTNKVALWKQLGQAKSYIGLEKYDQAKQLLLQIIEDNQYCVDAYDLLAQVYEANKKYGQAQEALATAIKISPISAPRQREMGRVCLHTGDNNVAAHAYRAAVKYSKNSCQEMPEDYTNLAHALSITLPKASDPQAMISEAFDTLRQLEKKYGKQLIAKVRRLLIEADLHRFTGKQQQAEQADEAALQAFENIKFSVVDNTSAQLSINCAKALMERGRYDEGERLLQELAQRNNNPRLAINIDKLLREPITKEGIAYAAKLNKQGINFHKKNQFDKAVASFQQVLDELPNHIGLNLNLIQSSISKSNDVPLNSKELSLIGSSFQRIGEIPEGSPYKQRYDYLIKRYQKLAQSKA